MEEKRRKELLEEYKNRKPEMGVISYKCNATGESFLGISKDTKSDINSTNAKLSFHYHPNKRLLELWNEFGMEGFCISVIKILKYENPLENHTEELEKLREKCLAEDEMATKIWK